MTAEIKSDKQPEKQASSRFETLFAYLSLALLAGSVIFIDQWTKAWVQHNLSLGESWTPFPSLLPFARILHWENAGASFGMFQNAGGIFTVLAVIVAGMIVFYFPRIQRGEWLLRLAMGLQLGGALGNLIDRLRFGSVTDFISVGNFAVFNVADSAITAGVVLLLLSIWFTGDEKPQTEQSPTQEHITGE